MKMLIDTNVSYDFSDLSMANPFPSNQSMSSFSSNSSIDEFLLTPESTPPHQRTPTDDYFKLQESCFALPTPSVSPGSYGASADFGTMSSMEKEIMAGLRSQAMMFTGDGNLYQETNMAPYNVFSNMVTPMCNMFDENNCLPPNARGLQLYDPTPGLNSNYSEDFVNPSQTMFLNMQSPQRPHSMSSGLGYDSTSPDSNCSSLSSGLITPKVPAANSSICSTRSERDSSPCCDLRTSGIQQHRFRPPPSSMALHKVQSDGQSTSNAVSSRLHLTRRRVKQESKDCFLPDNISRLEMSSKPCLYPGCSKKFRRQEHLKRHAKVHNKHLDRFPCQFCNHPFSRSDNLKSHMWLHADPARKGSKRTSYIGQAAMDIWLGMNSKPRKPADKIKKEIKKEIKIEP